MAGLLERWQGALALAAIAVGAAIGLLAPASAPVLGAVVEPAIVLLLVATFAALPLEELRDVRFLGAILVVDGLLAPLAAVALAALVADPGLRIGVLLVLLAPCVDYVVAFTRMAGGDATRLAAATPLLMAGQLLLIPAVLLLTVGEAGVAVVSVGPFLLAFAVFVLLPLAIAAALRLLAARTRSGAAVERALSGLMVPAMLVVLVAVVASQVVRVSGSLEGIAAALPLFVAFAVVMPVLGALVARGAGLAGPGRIAVALSGATRNSLVVLPIALAMPSGFELVPLVVVAQTLVELALMPALVRLVSRLAAALGR